MLADGPRPSRGPGRLRYNPHRHARRAAAPPLHQQAPRVPSALPRRRDTLRETLPTPAPTCRGPSALPLPRRAPRRLHAGRAPPPARTLRPAAARRPRSLLRQPRSRASAAKTAVRAPALERRLTRTAASQKLGRALGGRGLRARSEWRSRGRGAVESSEGRAERCRGRSGHTRAPPGRPGALHLLGSRALSGALRRTWRLMGRGTDSPPPPRTQWCLDSLFAKEQTCSCLRQRARDWYPEASACPGTCSLPFSRGSAIPASVYLELFRDGTSAFLMESGSIK